MKNIFFDRPFSGTLMSHYTLTMSILIFSAVSSSVLNADYSLEVLADNPIAYWKFDESSGSVMVDSSGNGNDGLYVGDPSRNPGAGYGTGLSLNLDGFNDYGTVTVTIGESFTAEVWARSSAATWNKNGWFASARSDSGFILHPDESGTTVRGFVYDSAGNFHAMTSVDVGAGNLQEFHHYVATYDADTDTGVFYLDGQVAETTTELLANNIRSPSTMIQLWLGRDQFGTDRYGFGQLDEMALYDTALSADRVEAHYNAATIALGDVNLDGNVDLLDVAPFVALLNEGGYQIEADINYDGSVNLLDVAPFVDLLSGG